VEVGIKPTLLSGWGMVTGKRKGKGTPHRRRDNVYVAYLIIKRYLNVECQALVPRENVWYITCTTRTCGTDRDSNLLCLN
jgi:hypothetical protein